PEALGTWRLLGASLILFLIFLFKDGAKKIFQSLRENIQWILITGTFFFFHLWSYFYSAQNTKIANCMILFATNPLFTALGAYLIFREKLTKYLIISYALAITGLYLLLSSTLQFNPHNLKGEIAGVISAFFYSTYVLSSKKTRQNLNNWHFAIGIYAVCGVWFLLLSFVNSVPLTGYNERSWLGVLGTIIVPTFMGHAIFTYLMSYLNINWMSCGKLLEPVFSASIAYFLFAETLNASTQIAFLFTFLAVLVLFYPKLTKVSVGTSNEKP
ncbi:MAG: DMT family transporter, partial [Bdellovibrionaceae bacterium]|nr:DMT family transporter [Pseudobdellovibrionaceae bacterium]